MADTKISALPSATTPLAGTELLPVVQAGATKNVPASAFQAALVPGTNIKTINGNSLLGSGDLPISGGSGSPGGSTTQIQFNDGGAFGGDAGLAFDKAAGKLTVGGKTVTASAPVLDLSQSWNNNLVTFTGIKFNVASDVSATGSLLMDLQVGGVSKFKVDKAGAATALGGINVGGQGNSSLIPAGWVGTLQTEGSAAMWFAAGSNALGNPSGGGISMNTTGIIGWGGTAPDLYIRRDLANTLAQRNGANGQTLRVYGNYLTGSDFRRLKMAMSLAGVAEIKPEDGGTYAGSTVLYISGLPTSNPGPGILWNNGGVVNVGT